MAIMLNKNIKFSLLKTMENEYIKAEENKFYAYNEKNEDYNPQVYEEIEYLQKKMIKDIKNHYYKSEDLSAEDLEYLSNSLEEEEKESMNELLYEEKYKSSKEKIFDPFSTDIYSTEDVNRKKTKSEKSYNSSESYYNKIESNEIEKKEEFEKKKFIKASFFMKIGHFIGLSLRNNYYKNLDINVENLLKNNEVFKVLEAQKNGYFLGKRLEVLTLEKLYNELTTNPIVLLNELVKRDILLSDYDLSLVLLSPKGKELIMNINPEENPYAKKLYTDLINKENFLYENKNVWLNSIKDKEKFLKEDNPLFYHEKMLSICEKSELIVVQKSLEKFLQDKEILKSISKNKLIDSMLLKLNMQLGNSIELEHVVLDLPKVAQNLYQSIKEITFSKEDEKILISSHQFEYELIEKRMPEAILKYLSVGSEYRNSLKSISGKTAENLLIETLENILVAKKDLSLFVNQAKLSDLSITRRYTDSIRGDIGKPSIVTLKTAFQLKESGELIDLSMDLENKKNQNNIDTNSQDNSIMKSKFNYSKKMKI